ncbi:TSUP family transporter [Rickettsiales bacterium LUAb2]
MLHNIIIDCSLFIVAVFAGFTDTIAGGGGLLTIPALILSGINPIIALGTNKLQAAAAELSAMWHFIKIKKVSYKVLKFGLLYTLIGSAIGTICLQFIPTTHLEKLIPLLLLIILIYFLYNTFSKKVKLLCKNITIITTKPSDLMILGNLIGFYNGFFGPATGSIWAVSLMHKFKLGLKEATMYAKPLNIIGNLTALMIFIITNKIDYPIALLMALGAIIGAKIGAHFVIYKNLKWLKLLFFILMSISITATFIKFY